MSPERDVIVDKKISAAVAEYPRTARALAVLQQPVPVITIIESGLSFWTEETRQAITIKTMMGPIITSKATDYVFQNMTEGELKTAHEDCVKILSRAIDWNDSILLRELRLKHSIPAGQIEQAIKDASSLYQRYQAEDRPFAILSLLEQTNITPLDLPTESQQIFLWAYDQEQKRKHDFSERHPEFR